MSASIGKLQIDFVANLAGFVTAVTKATSKVDQFAKATTERLRKVDAGLQQLGSKMTLKVTAPLLALAAVSVEAADQNKKFADTLERVGLQAQAAMKPLGRVLIDMFEQARPTIERGIALINGLAMEFERLEPQTKRMIVTGAAIAAAIGPSLLALSALGTVLKTAAAGFALATGAAMKFLAVLPYINAFLIGLGATIGSFQLGQWAYENIKPLQLALAGLASTVLEKFELIKHAGVTAWESINLAFLKMIRSITSIGVNKLASVLESVGYYGPADGLRAIDTVALAHTETFDGMLKRLTTEYEARVKDIRSAFEAEVAAIEADFAGQGELKDNWSESMGDKMFGWMDGATAGVQRLMESVRGAAASVEQLGMSLSPPLVQTEKDLRLAGEAAKQLESDLEKAIQFRFEAYPKEKLRADIANLEALRDRLRTVAPGILDDATVQKLSDQWAKALDKLDKKTQETFGDKLKGAVEDFSKNMSDAFADLVVDGEASFDQLAKSFGKMLVSMFAQQMAFQPLMSGLGAAIGMPFGAQTGTGGTPSAAPNALGGVHGPTGRLSAYASGGVVTKRTLFGHARGMGVMGEAGPEAIMPLERIGGKLGINAAGTGATVIVENHTGAPAEVQKSRGPDGRELTRVVVGVVKRALTAGDLDRDMRQNFGITRQPR